MVILGGQNIRESETRLCGDTRGTEYQGKWKNTIILFILYLSNSSMLYL